MKHVKTERRRFVIGIFGVVFLFILIAGLLQQGVPSLIRSRVAVVALVVCGSITWVIVLRRVRRAVGRRQKAWFVMSFAALCGVVANLWTLVTDLSALPDDWRVYADPILLAALGFSIAGLVIFPPVRRRRADLARMVLDGLVIGGSVLFVTSVTIFPQLLVGSQDRALWGRIQLLFLPAMDVLIATLASLLIMRSGRSSRVPLLLLGAGFWLYAFSDLAYAVLDATSNHTLGSLWDLGWIAGYLLFTLAALHPNAGLNPDQESSESSPVLSTVVLFVLFLAATLISLVQRDIGQLSFGARLVWAIVILAVVGRQIVLVVDNERLRRGLETRVQSRTRELREITRQQELLLTSVADGIYGVDRVGMITFVNAATADILHLPASRLIGRQAHDLFHASRVDGAPFPQSGCYITEAITSGLTATGEEDAYVCGDGRLIAVEVTASPLSGDDGISGAVVVFRDVSERHEMDRMKSEFVSIVSHELRTPLTSIRGALGLIAGGAFGPLPPQADRMIKIAMAGSERLSRLINDILDIERIESGMLPMSVTACDVLALCQEAVTVVSGMTGAVGVDIVKGRCEGVVRADHDRVIQTLINLLGNAVKFSRAGSQVGLKAAPYGDVVEFSVTDQGRGIPSEKLEAIFGRFTQVDSSDAREKGGTGLGLAISRTIVERLGGRIWAESVPGEGATFRFTLPREPAHRSADDQSDRTLENTGMLSLPGG